jgi:hypothetical protein
MIIVPPPSLLNFKICVETKHDRICSWKYLFGKFQLFNAVNNLDSDRIKRAPTEKTALRSKFHWVDTNIHLLTINMEKELCKACLREYRTSGGGVDIISNATL